MCFASTLVASVVSIVIVPCFIPLFLKWFQFLANIFQPGEINTEDLSWPDHSQFRKLSFLTMSAPPWRFRWRGLLNDRSSSWNINLCWTLPNWKAKGGPRVQWKGVGTYFGNTHFSIVVFLRFLWAFWTWLGVFWVFQNPARVTRYF